MGMIRLLRRLFYLSVVVFALTAIALFLSILWFQEKYPAERDYDHKLDTVLVLAAGLDPDSRLSFISRRRVRTAVWLLNQGVTDRLIFSGGEIAPNFVVAEHMKDFAVELGAPPQAIDLEAKSKTTWENFRFSYALIDQSGIQHIGLLTDSSHLGRALVLNEYLGGPAMTPIAAAGQFAPSEFWQGAEYSREILAWWYNLGKIAAWEVLGWFGQTEDERGEYIF